MNVPLGETMTTLTCHYQSGTCAAPAVWHLSWYDAAVSALEWENSLACQEHRDEAERRGWDIGWRHRVLPVCTLPGSRLHIAAEGDDEDGFPVSFCAHPFDEISLVQYADQPLSLSAAGCQTPVQSAAALAGDFAVQELSEGDASGVGLRLELGAVVAGHADADDFVACFAADRGGSADAALDCHDADNIRPRFRLTTRRVLGHNIHMANDTLTGITKIQALQVELAEEERRNGVRGVARSQRAAWLKRRIAVLSERAS